MKDSLKTALLSGTLFGLIMGFFAGVTKGLLFGIITGITLGVLFGLAMGVFVSLQSKNSRRIVRKSLTIKRLFLKVWLTISREPRALADGSI